MTEEFKSELEAEGYSLLTEVPGRGICGLRVFMFTCGLCYDLDEFQYKGRYCYRSTVEAAVAIKTWDGMGHPPGEWVKHKGEREFWNPNDKKD